MPHQHVTANERYQITHLHACGFSDAEIARHLGRHRGTIGRELKRNSGRDGFYHYIPAQAISQERRSNASQRYKLDDSPLGQTVREKLRQGCSPEQIAGRLKAEHPADATQHVTGEAIYQFVYRRHTMGEPLYTHLRRKRSRRRRRIVGERLGKRGQIPGRVGIEHRPPAVANRRRMGHWESDTIEGAKGSGLVVTHVERKSRYTCLGKLEDKRAAGLSEVTCRVMARIPAKLRKTMTADNGKEFTEFKVIEQGLGLKFYFANPHSPWERGTNENTNGLLREYLPKGSDFRTITDERLAEIERLLNNRPRKCLNYRTPFEVFTASPGVALQI